MLPSTRVMRWQLEGAWRRDTQAAARAPPPGECLLWLTGGSQHPAPGPQSSFRLGHPVCLGGAGDPRLPLPKQLPAPPTW